MHEDNFDSYHKWLGIPQDQRPPTFYQLLGISSEEKSEEVIRASARRQEDYVRKFND